MCYEHIHTVTRPHPLLQYIVSSCRLSESSGFITDDANLNFSRNYAGNSACLFFIDADRPSIVINLKVHLLHLECLWDYLQVFDGDSVFATKIATYTYVLWYFSCTNTMVYGIVIFRISVFHNEERRTGSVTESSQAL